MTETCLNSRQSPQQFLRSLRTHTHTKKLSIARKKKKKKKFDTSTTCVRVQLHCHHLERLNIPRIKMSFQFGIQIFTTPQWTLNIFKKERKKKEKPLETVTNNSVIPEVVFL